MSSALIKYSVTPLITRNVFAVQMRIQQHEPHGFEVYLPNWIAGSYMLRDFARHIIALKARDAYGKNLAVTPLNQYTWHVAGTQTEVFIDYDVYAHDVSVRTAFLDGQSGFFNGTSLFLSVKRLEQYPHQLTLKAPSHANNWEVATTLPRVSLTPERGFGQYLAKNYDELVDHPVRMGSLTWLSFKVKNVTHNIAISGHVPHLNRSLLIKDLSAVCAAQIDLFQSPAPFKQYLFLVDARAEGYGGLEHRDSTALLCSRDDLPNTDDSVVRREAYLTFLGLCSHEYFHAWNVKRIKPIPFMDYDLTQPIDTSLLWFFEGVTSYYDDLILFRTGLLSEEQYFKRLARTMNSVALHDGQATQTVTESGFYAWSKYYQTSPNTPNAVVSYYAKGALIALAMDLLIRQDSQNQASLDDVMRRLWQKFGNGFYEQAGTRCGVSLADIVHAAAFDAPRMVDFLERALCSVDALPLTALFKFHDIKTHHDTAVIQLGASVKKSDGGYVIQRVWNHGAAQKAGLAPDDVLLTFDKRKLNNTPDATLASLKEGQKVLVHFLRDDVLHRTILFNQRAKNGAVTLLRNQ